VPGNIHPLLFTCRKLLSRLLSRGKLAVSIRLCAVLLPIGKIGSRRTDWTPIRTKPSCRSLLRPSAARRRGSGRGCKLSVLLCLQLVRSELPLQSVYVVGGVVLHVRLRACRLSLLCVCKEPSSEN